MKKQKQRSDHGNGWVKMNRSEIMDEVIAKNRNAWCILSLIAKRAWRGPLQNRHGCRTGQAFVGDYATYGFTRMEYRTALSCLEQFGLIEIATSKLGTTITLVSSEIYDINVDSSVTDRGCEQPTPNQPPTNPQPRGSQRPAHPQPDSNH